jgi:polyphosphate kinase 2 (PPK2 family)
MLTSLDMTRSLDQADYDSQLKELQLKLVVAQRRIVDRRIPVILVFEGMDASGKGGCIKRLTAKLDPRGYEVHPIGPPDAHECRYHYLRRFWVRLPSYGRISVLDRSWYGRVLVERIEKLTPKAAWQRAYDEINQFERQVTDDDTVLLKFWLHITKAEQLARFEARQADPYKRWKITDEDWRNRERWDNYVDAAEDMIARTSTPYAPWTVVPANNKLYARILVLGATLAAIEAALERKGYGHGGPNCEAGPMSGARSIIETKG